MKIFVYGCYDSRGGTIAIEADSREEADRRYCAEFAEFGPTDIATNDFLGEAELIGADEAARGPEGAELCLYDEGSTSDEPVPMQWVIAPGEGVDDAEHAEFQEDGVTELRLWHRSQGPVPDGWFRPRWDDDAFSFWLFRK